MAGKFPFGFANSGIAINDAPLESVMSSVKYPSAVVASVCITSLVTVPAVTDDILTEQGVMSVAKLLY